MGRLGTRYANVPLSAGRTGWCVGPSRLPERPAAIALAGHSGFGPPGYWSQMGLLLAPRACQGGAMAEQVVHEFNRHRRGPRRGRGVFRPCLARRHRCCDRRRSRGRRALAGCGESQRYPPAAGLTVGDRALALPMIAVLRLMVVRRADGECEVVAVRRSGSTHEVTLRASAGTPVDILCYVMTITPRPRADLDLEVSPNAALW